MAHNYEEGRLNLPFVGIATFGKNPYVSNWSNINADAAIIGAPFDSGAQYRSGARFGPRSVREASTLFLLAMQELMIMKTALLTWKNL